MNGFKSIISFIASFFLIIVLMIFSIIVSVSSFASSDNMVKNTKRINFSLEFDKIRNSGSVSDKSIITSALDDIYDMASEFDVSKETIDNIINSSLSKEIIGMALGNITDYVINGNNNSIFSSDDIYKIVDENIDGVLKDMSISISEGQKEKFLNRLKLELPDLVKSIPTVGDIIKNKSIEKIQFLFSGFLKTTLLILIILFVCLIVFLKRMDSIIYIVVSFVISGLLLMIVSLFIPSLFMSIIKGVDISIFINAYAQLLSQKVLMCGMTLCAFSIIIFLISRLFGRK